jgi:hypothetical protein
VSVGFIKMTFVTIHGHMNLKFIEGCLSCKEAGPVLSAVESAKKFVCFSTKSNSINGCRLARCSRRKKQESRCLQCTKCTTLMLLVLKV